MSPIPFDKPAKPVSNLHPDTEDRLQQLSLADLHELIIRVTAVRDSRLGAERQRFLARTRSEAKVLGICLPDSFEHTIKMDRQVMYRGPRGEQWHGVGAHPAWLRTELSEGAKVDDFRIRAPLDNT
jgi:hypothetical protein